MATVGYGYQEPPPPYTANGHREMAVDVPQDFEGTVKGTPRYPPPAASMPKTNPHASPTHYPGRPRPSSDGEEVAQDSLTAAIIRPSGNSQETIAKFRRSQEERRRRKQDEETQRNALRESARLRQLAERRPAGPGIENEAFEDDMDTSSTNQLDVSAALKSIKQLRNQLSSSQQQDADVITELLNQPRFQRALQLQHSLLERRAQPSGTEVLPAAQQATQHPSSSPALDLQTIISKPSVQNLLKTHDVVAAAEAPPEVAVPDDQLLQQAGLGHTSHDSVKIVKLNKSNDPLGATIKNENDAVIVGRIVRGGVAESSGLLHEGDEILEINGIDMRGKNVNDVCDILSNLNGILTFLIIPSDHPTAHRPNDANLVHIRALFDYDPEDDPYIPCRELGLSFRRGDLLHVTSQADSNWWQAYREGESDLLAGLIPSSNFHKQREVARVAVEQDVEERPKKRCFCVKKKSKRKMYDPGNDVIEDDVMTYEEVMLYYPLRNKPRPVVLIGAQNVGRKELRQKLLESAPELYAAAIPHTTSARKPHEVHGKDYYFVPKHVFEADRAAGLFVEFGNYEGNYYGTSVTSIEQLVQQGKTCVLNLHPSAVQLLRESKLHPYVFFVSPPNLEKLRQNRLKAGHNVQDDELRDIIDKSRAMESEFGHVIDYVLVNTDLQRCFDELQAELNRIQHEPQWVPAEWVRHDPEQQQAAANAARQQASTQ